RTGGPGRSRVRVLGAIATAVGLVISLLTIAPAVAAPGDPFDPSVPRVFVAQDVPTRLYTAIQGNGAVTFTPEGATADRGYNAMGYDTANNYLYAIRRDTGFTNALQRIGQGGVVVGLGAVSGLPVSTATYNQGTFGAGATAHILYVRETGATNRMYAVNVTTLTATTVALSATPQLISDIVYKDGYVWGFSDTDRVYRIDPATGQVSSWATGFGLNLAFGAQWVYGNGNIGLSANATGRVYQVRIDGSATPNPTFTLVASSTGPASANNDGAAIPGADVDLGIVKTGPATYSAGGALTYTLTVTNNSAVGSSGYVVTDPLPAALTGATTATAGCAVSGGTLTCVRGPLAAGASSTITVTGTVAAGTTGILSNTATVLGNEHDPNPTNDQSTATSLFSAPLSCTAGNVYGLNRSGELTSISATTGAATQVGYFPAGASIILNGLGMSPDGRYAYAVAQTGTKMTYRFDTQTGVATPMGVIPQTSTFDFVFGAVNPVNGWYYVGGRSGSQYIVYAFDPVAGVSRGEQFRMTAPTPAPTSPNGDFVFDSTGRLIMAMSTGNGTAAANPLGIVETVPSDGSVATVRPLAFVAPTTALPEGAAFGADGYLYVVYANTANVRSLQRTDPNSGAVVSTVTIGAPGSGSGGVADLASCSLNSTLTLRKDVAGRFGPADQFTVSITGNGVAQGNTGTTSGTATGVQTTPSASAGPVVGVPGRTYAIAESAAPGTDLAHYTTTWQCVNTANGTVLASGAGVTGTITVPAAPAAGIHVVCAFQNTPILAWQLAKQALVAGVVLAPSAIVQPGTSIDYRVTATNATATAIPGVTLRDDLSQVLDDATFVPGSAQLAIGAAAPVAVADPAAGTLTTTGFTLPAGTTAVLTYRVTVRADAWAATIRNAVTGTAGTPASPIPPDPCPTACTTTQLTPTVLQVQKVGEDSAGMVVPMNGSQWAVYSAATGGSPVIASVAGAVDAGGSPITGLFRDTTLSPGTYWLQETRALPGFALLAGRVGFTVAADGHLTLAPGTAPNASIVQVGGIDTIRVQDIPALALPEAGGSGTRWIYLVGLLLVIAALSYGAVVFLRRSRRQPGRRREGS
ncbi:MAG: DUF11 domain-containing protein, partial [Microbacterium sp.]|nr:DUF11 domain-containing protein [Microbacterium sp.]